MNENELRLGNIIETFKGDYELVHGVYTTPDYIEISTQNCAGLIVDFKPIPITEEWLVKFGFKAKRGFYNLNAFNIEVIGDFEYLSFSIIDSAYDFTLKYVHQLQNIIFALTNEELTIK